MKISLGGTNQEPSIIAPEFKLDKDGLLLKGGLVSGATIGGGWSVGENSIYHTKDSLTSEKDGIYIGTNGMSLGSDFEVTAAG
jgi:hypothetical protein